MKVKICDLCGERCERKGALKVKVKRLWTGWEGTGGWTKLDICDNCAEAIVKQSRELRKEEEE